jgi:hypothetical protein
MIRNETIVKDDYTIHVTLNDGMVRRGGQLIVHATIVRTNSTQHISVGKANTDEWETWATDAAALVAARPPVPPGLEESDWK